MSRVPSLEELYDQHANALFAFAVNLLRNESDARDVLQEIFIKLAQRPELLAKVADTRAFLLRLAHNSSVDLIRRQSTRVRNYEELAQECVELFADSAN